MTPAPAARRRPTTSSRPPISRSVNEAVGSSMIRMRALAPIAFAISTSCRSGMLKRPTSRSGSIAAPTCLRICDAMDRASRDGQRAGVGALGARDDLDEGGLAGAVLADERVHLAGREIERHA